MAACKRAKKKQQAKIWEILKKNSKAKKNKIVIQSTFYWNDSNSEDLISKTESTNIENEDDWKDNVNHSQHEKKSSWIDAGNISQVKEKLIRIFIRKTLISKQ